MARTRSLVKKARRSPRKATKTKRAIRRVAGTTDPLLRAVETATRREVGGAVIDTCSAGAARVKRVVYPPGFRWSVNMKPTVGTDLCMHAHVGFLARGEIHIEYPDGCVVEYAAPRVVAIDPGHDGWVVGRKPAVLIEFDFERDTVDRLGMATSHRHDPDSRTVPP